MNASNERTREQMIGELLTIVAARDDDDLRLVLFLAELLQLGKLNRSLTLRELLFNLLCDADGSEPVRLPANAPVASEEVTA